MKIYAIAKTRDPRKTGSAADLVDPIWRGQAPAIRRVLHGPALQAKLTIGAPDDTYEREADQVADRVMRLSDPEVRTTRAPPRVPRLCPECEGELRTKPLDDGSNPAAPVPPIVHEVLRSSGQPLDTASRAFSNAFRLRLRRCTSTYGRWSGGVGLIRLGAFLHSGAPRRLRSRAILGRDRSGPTPAGA